MVLKNQHRVVARIPLVKDGRVVGAAGKLMFMSPEKLKELYGRIEALKNNLDFYKETLNQVYGSRYTFENIIGNSALSLQAKALARQAAESDSPVLIIGESGTGKELFAHAIHQISRRRNHNFVKVNSASIPGELIESELFGYEPGAFTGARKQGKPGKFELSHQGTIFLDEIGDMPPLLAGKADAGAAGKGNRTDRRQDPGRSTSGSSAPPIWILKPWSGRKPFASICSTG